MLERVIQFHKDQIIRGYENGMPEVQRNSHRLRLAMHLGVQSVRKLLATEETVIPLPRAQITYFPDEEAA